MSTVPLTSLDTITAIGSILTPILVLVLTAVGWKYRQSIERRIKAEEELRDDRVAIYNQILQPYIILFMADDAWQSDPKNRKKDKQATALSMLLSLDYRQAAFKLALMGSDEVGKALTQLMLLSNRYSQQEHTDITGSTKDVMSQLGDLLLAIRKKHG